MTQQSYTAEQTGSAMMAAQARFRLLTLRVLTPVLDLIFPPVCVGCERVGSLLCESCVATFTPVPSSGRSVGPLVADQCALGGFEGALQAAVHALKYEHVRHLADPLGRLMAEAIRAADWPISLIVPVPLHEDRLHQRGYNQAVLLGAVVADQLGWPQAPDVLARTRDTRSQVGLGYQERQENVADAFSVTDPARLIGCDIVLVDDVCTTGATLRECATILLEVGARSVRSIVVGQAGATL